MSSNIAVFDLDRTITRIGTYTPFILASMPVDRGAPLRIAKGLLVGAAYAARRISRATAKSRMLALSIAGQPREKVAAWSEEFVGRWLSSRVRPGALAAVARHRAAGDHMVLATASFDFYAAVFAQRLGFHHLIATPSVWDQSDRLVAAVGGENCYGPVKLAAVQAYIAKLGAKPRVVSYSDHHSDFELLRWSDEGVAVNPNAKLRRLAESAKMRIADWEVTSSPQGA